MKILLFVFAFISLALPTLLIGWILLKGWAAIDLTFLTQAESDFGSKGGIFYQVWGSLILVGFAALIAGPLGWVLGVFRQTYVKQNAFGRWLNFLFYTLNGVPSIIFGLFGYLCFVKGLGLGLSWVSGGLILSLMILPTVAITVSEGLESLPQDEIQAAQALGLHPFQLIKAVLWPESRRFLWTGLTLGLTRAVGETAPIFFTAAVFSGVTLPQSWKDPVVTLPTHIMTLAQEAANPIAIQNAWGTAFVLVALVGIFGSLSWVLRSNIIRSHFK